MEPFVDRRGYVFPCCEIDSKSPDGDNIYYNERLIPSPFVRPEFNLHNHSYNEIVESVLWRESINKLYDINFNTCKRMCSYFFVDNNKIAHMWQVLNRDNKLTASRDENIFREYKKVDTIDINKIQLELTSRCGLLCPLCPRTIQKTKNHDLEPDILHTLIQSRQWDSIIDCGNRGDSVFYPFYHDFLYMLKGNVKNYSISVSSTGKGEQWWEKTISLYKHLKNNGVNIRIKFGIDGLKDTSKLYRKNQNWNEIIEAVKMCIDAKIHTTWQLIPFSFNEHQIKEVENFAKELGCHYFYVKRSGRFETNDKLKPASEDLFINFENYI